MSETLAFHTGTAQHRQDNTWKMKIPMSKNESPAVGTELSLRQGRFSLVAVASVKASARALNSGFLPGPRWVKSPNERLNS